MEKKNYQAPALFVSSVSIGRLCLNEGSQDVIGPGEPGPVTGKERNDDTERNNVGVLW